MMKLDGVIALTNRQRKKQDRARPRQKREKPVKVKAVEPTPEQKKKNSFQTAGPAYRKTPVIDTMLKREQITQDEHIKLTYYRQQASLADTSLVRSNCDFSVSGGNGEGPAAAVISASFETNRIERDMGVLYPIVRAVAVGDVSLSGWIDTQGKVATTRRIGFAMLDFRFGVGRIVI